MQNYKFYYQDYSQIERKKLVWILIINKLQGIASKTTKNNKKLKI